jgi:formylglycine-generating enzyme required for sulfatase activity
MQGTPLTTVTGMLLVCLTLVGLPQASARAVVDTTPPTGTIIINNNRSATNTPNVMLVLTWDDGIDGSGVSRMRFSNDGATWSVWEALAETRAYTLPSGEGHKTVRVQYLDKANNRSVIYNDYIRQDTTPPIGTVTINNGDVSSMNRSVTLGLTWSDGVGVGVTRMRFSDNGSTWTAWMPLTAAHTHTLPAGLGYHTVRVQYLDGANNYSPVYNDYIKLVELAPGTTEIMMLPGNVPLAMVWVASGTFTMGSPVTEEDREGNESPQHAVTLNGFWMGKYELTKRQWTAVMGTAPWTGEDNVLADLDSPAVWVSWNDAQAFVTALNGVTGKIFRLPSEAQWEYACRAGTTTRFYWGDADQSTYIKGYAWYEVNCYGFAEGSGVNLMNSHVVGLKLPNAFGLYDMSGNAHEWCQDKAHSTYSGAPTDGSAWETLTGLNRVRRGGGWNSFDFDLRSAHSCADYPSHTLSSVGFRLSRP